MENVHLMPAAAMMAASTAQAERSIMATHTQGTDPFWPVVEKGAKDAAAAMGVELEYNFAPSGDMSDMAALIEAGAATSPDGMIISLPDADALGGAVRAAIGAGIPVITINAGPGFVDKSNAAAVADQAGAAGCGDLTWLTGQSEIRVAPFFVNGSQI